MPRNHHYRVSPATPTQRQLRSGELIRHSIASATLVLFFLPPAHAEVCDKAVGESWRPADRPVWLLNPAGWPIAFAVLIGGMIVVDFLKLRWVGYLVSGLLVIYVVVLVFADLIPQHYIYQQEVREGCRSFKADLADAALMLFFAGSYAWLGYRAKRGVAAN
jgi:hypothetical protein